MAYATDLLKPFVDLSNMMEMRHMKSLRLSLATVLFLSFFLFWHLQQWCEDASFETSRFSIDEFRISKESCSSLPGANETLVILKTGSTELYNKLPIHMKTTLRCYPNYLIFSDYEEYYRAEHILDALESVDADIRANHLDFEMHRRLERDGRAILAPSEPREAPSLTSTGNADNPGWKLDKWKFLPMVDRALHEYPDMKWYIFAEVDTYILWASMLQYLAALDPDKPHYTGSQMHIGDVLFAHGGSGFMVSQPAMRMVVAHYQAHKREVETFTDGHWAGDCVLGKAFADAGVPFTNAWPIVQGDYPGIVAYARPDGRPIANAEMRIWCYPVVSYHHVPPGTIDDLWHFEQQWLVGRNDSDTGFFRHRDMFDQYIMPRMSAPKSDWDNESDQTVELHVPSFGACKASCEARDVCRQYSFDRNGTCSIREDPRLGVPKTGVRSGWLTHRMQDFRDGMAPCGDEGWLI